MIIIPGDIENNAHAKFWGANKVHYTKSCNVEVCANLSPRYVIESEIPRTRQNLKKKTSPVSVLSCLVKTE